MLTATRSLHGGANAMCAKCDEIDARITRYKRMASELNDKALNEGLVGLLEKMMAVKASYHPEQEKK